MRIPGSWRMWAVVAALTVVACFASPTSAQDAAAASPTSPEKRVLIISVDGLRPDVMLRAFCPNIRVLMVRGSYTMWANTTDVAITLPSHVSMLTGVPPEVHGINHNQVVAGTGVQYPKVSTLFELAKAAGFSTAVVAGKAKFDSLTKPSAVDWAFVPTLDVCTDDDVLAKATEIIAAHHPQVMFVHFPDTDSAGHGKGWGSPEQIEVVGKVDEAIGKLLKAWGSEEMKETMVILTSDHGGAGISHGANDARSRHIPWLLVGPGVRPDYDLTRQVELTVNTEDTFATACDWLGVEPPAAVKGKSILPLIQQP